MIESLARQNLPKCHPDVFNGDVTMFHQLNYLYKYTTGDPRRLLDSFRKRQYRKPETSLKETWNEMESRFGNTAAISRSLLEQLVEKATFDENDRKRLQEFSDLCMDVTSQLDLLPGLACLNYPIAIRPIVERLPTSLQRKWEKKVVTYAIDNDDDYPDFRAFATTIERQAKTKNHPNILANTPTNPDDSPVDTEIQSNCTDVCKNSDAGLLATKIVLVDVFTSERPENIHRVYALLDEQSNLSMVSPELANKLGKEEEKEKYLLSTCSGSKEVRYGRRLSGIIARSLDGEQIELPTCIECNSIPEDKREIPTPIMASRFPHLEAIANEIPP